jgi:hypothetical protein
MKTLVLFALLLSALATGPQITTQPVGGVYPKPYSISVAALGKLPMAYQWQYAGAQAGPWKDVPNENAATLAFPNPLPPGNYYRCIVSNSDGYAVSNAVPVQITP